MTYTIYKSSDTDAPQLTNAAGDKSFDLGKIRKENGSWLIVAGKSFFWLFLKKTSEAASAPFFFGNLTGLIPESVGNPTAGITSHQYGYAYPQSPCIFSSRFEVLRKTSAGDFYASTAFGIGGYNLTGASLFAYFDIFAVLGTSIYKLPAIKACLKHIGLDDCEAVVGTDAFVMNVYNRSASAVHTVILDLNDES